MDRMHTDFGCRSGQPDNSPKIICLGDSITYGALTPVRNTWPAKAEEALGIPFFNLAYPGAGMLKIAEHWKKHQDLYKSITSFVLQIPNFDRHARPDRPFRDGVNDHTYENGFMAGVRRNLPLADDMMARYAVEFISADRKALSALLVSLSAIAPVVVLSLPHCGMVASEIDAFSPTWFEMANSISQRYSVHVIDVSIFYSREREDTMIINSGDCLLNETGHELVAGHVIEYLGSIHAQL